MSAHHRPGQPLSLTLSPKLDAALLAGWEAWEVAARAEGADRVAAWLARRLEELPATAELVEPIAALLGAEDDEHRAIARAELAELVEGDDLLADTLWEGVLADGLETADPDLIFEATSRLAALAEEHGDPLAAAEYAIDFLNWRRQPEHASDVEAVETAFDEIVRLARLDGDQRAAALYEYRQAGFTRLAEAEDERATAGDWESQPAPYQSWA